MRSSGRIFRSFGRHTWRVPYALILVVWLTPLGAPQAREPVDLSAPGVKHALKGAIFFDVSGLDSGVVRKSESTRVQSDDGAIASVQADIRISSHAPNADFYGVVTPKFSDVGKGQRGEEQIIWESAKCHHDRGLPKITVMAIYGQIADGDARVTVSAIPRRIGKLIPDDEILTTRKQPLIRLHDRAELSMQASTTMSRLVLTLQLVSQRCSI